MFLLVTGASGAGKSTVRRAVEREFAPWCGCAELATRGVTPEGLAGLAVCLLDVRPEAQTARLAARGDDPRYLPAHLALAEWMRRHVAGPGHRPARRVA